MHELIDMVFGVSKLNVSELMPMKECNDTVMLPKVCFVHADCKGFHMEGVKLVQQFYERFR